MAPHRVVPFSLKGAPSLIEKVFPAQRLSIESYKEQMAGSGKTLTVLGSYWKGRKPLILNKACILGCLLPATDNSVQDLRIFEKLMAMDDESFVIRWKTRPKPEDILAHVPIERIGDVFETIPDHVLPISSPVNWSNPDYKGVSVEWRSNISEAKRRYLEAQVLPRITYRQRVDASRRPEEVASDVHDHIWDEVNRHLDTEAHSFPDLVEQLGVMRFGHRPSVADVFCGSGQIPFEAARLGSDVYASDLNPIASMLTWGAFNIVASDSDSRNVLESEQEQLIAEVQAEISRLGVEVDGNGWQAKTFLYCVEVRCPQTGWMVPLLPSLVISKPRTGEKNNVVAEIVPDPGNKRYDISVRSHVSEGGLVKASRGTVRSEGPGQDPYLVHTVNGAEYRTKISTLRGDYQKPDGTTRNRLRLWDKGDFLPRPDDVFQERLYCIQWMRSDKPGEYEFRAVTEGDLERERIVRHYISRRLEEWQANGWVPDMRIEAGTETERLYRERGWTHWHHLFNPRQLLIASLVNQRRNARLSLGLAQVINWNSRLSGWNIGSGGGGSVQQTFYNQALNTLFNYGCRSFATCARQLRVGGKNYPLDMRVKTLVACHPASELANSHDIYITDPPYGDAVNYDEILEFFIAWLRRNPPPEFAEWTWDSRRSLAIKGQDDDFQRGMVAAYKRMAENMPDSGIQIIMFTHQSPAIWAEMANIVWAAGLQVTAAWCVATEVDSALKGGYYVKGTVLLVVRKRKEVLQTTSDELTFEVRDEVLNQVATMIGLNQDTKGLHRDENLFEDADLQIAGHAAALRILTKYSMVDGKDMAIEALRPRVKGQTTFVDNLIEFAVDVANQCLVPEGIRQTTWDDLRPAERFYLKMAEMEARGLQSLDNYQNFGKAFKVKDFRLLMASGKANSARLKSANELGKTEMAGDSELAETAVRAILHAIWEVSKDIDVDEAIGHLANLMPGYYNSRDIVVEISDYLAKHMATTHPEEARAARILRERVKNQPM